MRRDTIATVVLAIGGVLALAVAGATIDDLRQEGDGSGSGEGEGPEAPPAPERGSPEFDVVPTVPGELVMIILLGLMAILLLIYLIRNWEQALVYLAASAIILLGLVLIFHFFPWEPDLSPIQDELDFENISPGNGEGGGDGGPPGPPVIGDWFPVFLLLGGLAVVAVAMSVLASRGEDASSAAAPEQSAGPSPDLTGDIGAAAGRAADRLEADEGRENEVYRAWVEMIELLDVGDPRSATPGAFAREAARAGVAADDVADLTGLFEEVRYGDRPPTVRREREAVELLRRIEDRYATAAGGGPDGER